VVQGFPCKKRLADILTHDINEWIAHSLKHPGERTGEPVLPARPTLNSTGEASSTPPRPLVVLLLDPIAKVFDGVANLVFDGTDTFTKVTGRFVRDPFVVKCGVVRQIPDTLLDFALDRLGLAGNLILVQHGTFLPRGKRTCSFHCKPAATDHGWDALLPGK